MCPKCETKVQIELAFNAIEIHCTCGYNFCSKCFEPWHEEIICDLMSKYKIVERFEKKYIAVKSSNINEEFFKWLKTKTKVINFMIL